MGPFECECLNILTGAGILLGILYLYFTRNFDYWKKRGVPYMKPEVFFGNIRKQATLSQSQTLIMKEAYDAFEEHKFVGGFMFQKPFLLLRDPELIKSFTVKDFTSFHDRGIPTDEVRRPLSGNLFNIQGARWRALRTKLSPTFTSGKMKMMYHLVVECSEELRMHLKEAARRGDNLEMREVLAQLTTDVIGTCAFGIQFNSMKDKNSEFRRMGRKVFESSISNMVRRVFVLFLPAIAKFMGIGLSSAEVNDFFMNAVKETVEYREKNNITRNDFMHLLIQLKNNGALEDDRDAGEKHQDENDTKIEDQLVMTDNLLAAQAFVFFLAGFETSSTTMSYALYELALNPDLQTRLRNEIDVVLKKHGGNITYDALQEMQYLDKVISETLRKYPPGTNLMRACTKEYTIPETEVIIEEGTRVFIPVYAIHHDPKYYPNPELFDPERFNEEHKANRPNYTYMPFGEGPRNCIGMRFGLMQSKVGLVSVLRDYHFDPCERTVVPIRPDPMSFVLAPIDGIWLKISPRD